MKGFVFFFVLSLSETNVLSCLDSKGSPNGYEKD